MLIAFSSANERQAGSDFPVPTFALPQNVAFSSTVQPGRFDVTTHRGTCLEFTAFSHENIALHLPSHIHRFGPDLTSYARVLPDHERSVGIDCALHLAIDAQPVEEFDRAFDRNSSGEKSAGLRWHERAVGWPWDEG